MEHITRRHLGTALVAFMAAGVIGLEEPPVERTIVTATSDPALNRILVRWQQIEGTQKRFSHYGVLRREAGAITLSPLNPNPIGALTTVVELEALFTQSGLADAGWKIPEAQGNFVWFELGERTADFAAAADELGIVVRPFAGEGARVSIGEDEANDRVLELARAFPH